MNTIPLGELVTIKGGGTPDKSRAEFWGGSIPWASVKDFKSTTLSQTVDSITIEGVANSATNIIPAGSIIVPTRMAVGKAAINAIDMAINQDLKALLPNKKVDTRYLLNALLARAAVLEVQATGATVKGITLEVLKALKIPLPLLDEQRRIAAILDQADALRRKRREAIDVARTLPRALMNQLLFSANESRRDFKKQKLSDLVRNNDTINYGVVQPGDEVEHGVRLIRVSNVVDNDFSDRSMKQISTSIESKYTRSRLKGDEILVACVGSVGAVAVASTELKGANIARAVARISADPNRVNRTYLTEYLKSDICQRYFKKETRTVAQPTLNIKQLSQTVIELPEMHEQKLFASKVSVIQNIIANYEEGIEELNSLFTTLQHRAFRGEL